MTPHKICFQACDPGDTLEPWDIGIGVSSVSVKVLPIDGHVDTSYFQTRLCLYVESHLRTLPSFGILKCSNLLVLYFTKSGNQICQATNKKNRRLEEWRPVDSKRKASNAFTDLSTKPMSAPAFNNAATTSESGHSFFVHTTVCILSIAWFSHTLCCTSHQSQICSVAHKWTNDCCAAAETNSLPSTVSAAFACPFLDATFHIAQCLTFPSLLLDCLKRAKVCIWGVKVSQLPATHSFYPQPEEVRCSIFSQRTISGVLPSLSGRLTSIRS